MTLKLIIGNKNYSSWSMRPWIAMKAAKIPFEETVISLNAPNFKDVLGPVSGTGKVPTLIDGDVRVWEVSGNPRVSGGEIPECPALAGR
jgi:glutathione S-transferase